MWCSLATQAAVRRLQPSGSYTCDFGRSLCYLCAVNEKVFSFHWASLLSMGKKCRKKIHWRKLSLHELPTEKFHSEDSGNDEPIAFAQRNQEQSYQSTVKSNQFSQNEISFDQSYKKCPTSERSPFPRFTKNVYNDHLSPFYGVKRRPLKMFDRVEFHIQSPFSHGDEPIKRRWSERGRVFMEEGRTDDKPHLREEGEKLSQPVHTVLIDNEEYTKIHTPRQEVIFKKSSLDRKRDSVDLEFSASASESANGGDPIYQSEQGSVTESVEDAFILSSEESNQETWEENRLSYDDTNNLFLMEPGKPPLAGVVMQQTHPGGPMISIPVHWTPYLEPGLIPGETALTPLDPTFTHIIDPKDLPNESAHILPIQRDSNGCPVTVQVKVDNNGLPVEIEPNAFTVSLSTLDASQRDTILHRSPDLFHMAAQIQARKGNFLYANPAQREDQADIKCLAYHETRCDLEVETSIVSNACYKNSANGERKDSEESSPDSQYSSMSEASTAPTTPSEELCDGSDSVISSNSKERNEQLHSSLLSVTPLVDSTNENLHSEESSTFSKEEIYREQSLLKEQSLDFSNKERSPESEIASNETVRNVTTENHIKGFSGKNIEKSLNKKRSIVMNKDLKQSINTCIDDSSEEVSTGIKANSLLPSSDERNKDYEEQKNEKGLIADSNHSTTNKISSTNSFNAIKTDNVKSEMDGVHCLPKCMDEETPTLGSEKCASTNDSNDSSPNLDEESSAKENKDSYTCKSGYVMVPILTPYYDPAVLYGYPVVIPGNPNERYERNFCRKKKKKIKKKYQEDMFLETDLYTGKPFVATPNGYMVPVESPEMCHVHGFQYLPSMQYSFLPDEGVSAKRSPDRSEISSEINCNDRLMNEKKNHNSASIKRGEKEQQRRVEGLLQGKHDSVSDPTNCEESCESDILEPDNLSHKNFVNASELEEKKVENDLEHLDSEKDQVSSNLLKEGTNKRKSAKNEINKSKKVSKKKSGKQKKIENKNETIEILEPDFTSFSNGTFRFESKKDQAAPTHNSENKRSSKRKLQNSVSEEFKHSCNRNSNAENDTEANKFSRLSAEFEEAQHLEIVSKETTETSTSFKTHARRKRSKNLKQVVMEENTYFQNTGGENNSSLSDGVHNYSPETNIITSKNNQEKNCEESDPSCLEAEQSSGKVSANETTEKRVKVETQISSVEAVPLSVAPKLSTSSVGTTSTAEIVTPFSLSVVIAPTSSAIVAPILSSELVSQTSSSAVITQISPTALVPPKSSPKLFSAPAVETAENFLAKTDIPPSKNKDALLTEQDVFDFNPLPKEHKITYKIYPHDFKALGVTKAVKNWITEVTPQQAFSMPDYYLSSVLPSSPTESEDDFDDEDNSYNTDDDNDDASDEVSVERNEMLVETCDTARWEKNVRLSPFIFAHSNLTAVKLLFHPFQSLTSEFKFAGENIRSKKCPTNISLPLSSSPDSKQCHYKGAYAAISYLDSSREAEFNKSSIISLQKKKSSYHFSGENLNDNSIARKISNRQSRQKFDSAEAFTFSNIKENNIDTVPLTQENNKRKTEVTATRNICPSENNILEENCDNKASLSSIGKLSSFDTANNGITAQNVKLVSPCKTELKQTPQSSVCDSRNRGKDSSYCSVM